LNSGLVGSLLTILFPFVVHLDISKKYGGTGWLPDRVLMENFLKFIWLYIFSPETLPQATSVQSTCHGSSIFSCQHNGITCKPSACLKKGENASFI